MPTLSRTINNQQLTINRKSKGFTLIELLVVIVIIGILASFAVASFTSAQAKGRDSRRKADLDALKKALELSKSDTTGGAYYPFEISQATLVDPKYIKVIPADPSNSTVAYTYTPGDAGCSTDCTNYTLVACLENAKDPQQDAVNICTSPLVSYTISNP